MWETLVNYDYRGVERNTSNPSPGPFEVKKVGKNEWKVWSDRSLTKKDL